MKGNTMAAFALFLIVAACESEERSAVPVSGCAVRLELSVAGSFVKSGSLSGSEMKVNDIKAFVFNGNSLDAYRCVSADEITSNVLDLECTQGKRDIWVVVNGPSALGNVTTLQGLRETVSDMTADNAATMDSFVMVGRVENQNLTAACRLTVYVDRIVSRVRLFQVRRDMSSPAFAADTCDVKITRVYMTCVIGNACIDIFAPLHPDTYDWMSCIWAGGSAIAADNAFIYDRLVPAVSIAEDAVYGTAYVDSSTVATHTFYVYPNEFPVRSNPVVSDQTKLVVECMIDGNFYTYPVPLGVIGNNRSYDVRMLTITRPGNDSDGDDEVDEGEDDVINPVDAAFSVSVDEWIRVTDFDGVADGVVTI